MQIEDNTAEPSQVNGGEPTDQEALYASQVDTIGDNPSEEPVAAPAPAPAPAAAAPAPAPAAAPAAAGAPAATDEEAAAEAAAVANADTAAAPAAAPAAAAPEPAPAPVVAPAPKPPMDFDAAFIENKRQYDEGEIDGDAFEKNLRDYGKQEAAYTARMAIWEERQQTAAEQAAQSFNTTAASWEQQNADFMANPLRAQQMQAAIVAVDKMTPGLSPAQLFDAAAKIAFEAFNWQPKGATAVDTAAIEAAALAARKPAGVPQTLASAAAAAPIENAATNSTYGTLDTKDISSLEDAVARMTKDQQDAYLRDSPGSNSPATNKAQGMG